MEVNVEPYIKNFTEMNFVGKQMKVSLSENKTVMLWRSFMPRRGDIINTIGSELYSIEVYPQSFFENFNPASEFTKWAASRVKNIDEMPDGMEGMTIAGLYAVFLYRGAASEGHQFYQYMLQSWLPTSEYLLDERPHFAIMGEKYVNNSPDSEEELCIPIRKK